MGTFLIRYATITITIVENHPAAIEKNTTQNNPWMFLKP
jgi:hypothetical protein